MGIKKVVILGLIILFVLVGCADSEANIESLPNGRAKNIVLVGSSGSWHDHTGSGNFKFLSDSLIEYVVDETGEVLYIPTNNVIKLIVESTD